MELFFKFKRWKALPATLMLSAFLAAPKLHSEYENSIVASVDGDPITLFDIVNETIKSEVRKGHFGSGEKIREEVFTNRKKTLDDMIDRKLIYKDFKAKGYQIPRQFIESTIDEIAIKLAGGDRKKLVEKVEESGITFEEFREKVFEKSAVDIMINEFCDRLVNITPEQIRKHYDSNPGEFITPPKTELQIIYLDRNGARKDDIVRLSEEISKKMENIDESAFAEAAKEYSDGPTKEDGGRSGWVENEKLRKEFRDALVELKVDAKAGPIETEEGIYFARVSGTIPETQTAYQDAEEEIRKNLAEKERKARYEEYVRKLREKAVIKFFFESAE